MFLRARRHGRSRLGKAEFLSWRNRTSTPRFARIFSVRWRRRMVNKSDCLFIRSIQKTGGCISRIDKSHAYFKYSDLAILSAAYAILSFRLSRYLRTVESSDWDRRNSTPSNLNGRRVDHRTIIRSVTHVHRQSTTQAAEYRNRLHRGLRGRNGSGWESQMENYQLDGSWRSPIERRAPGIDHVLLHSPIATCNRWCVNVI